MLWQWCNSERLLLELKILFIFVRCSFRGVGAGDIWVVVWLYCSLYVHGRGAVSLRRVLSHVSSSSLYLHLATSSHCETGSWGQRLLKAIQTLYNPNAIPFAHRFTCFWVISRPWQNRPYIFSYQKPFLVWKIFTFFYIDNKSMTIK